MDEFEYVPGILVKGILGTLDHKPEEHCPISTEDADKNGHDQTGHVLIKAVLVQPCANSADYVLDHGQLKIMGVVVSVKSASPGQVALDENCCLNPSFIVCTQNQ